MIKITKYIFIYLFFICNCAKSMQILLDDFKKYKVTNPYHAGNQYEHSIWVARATNDLLKSSWGSGLEQNVMHAVIIAGFIHDIGKAGDLDKSFYVKKDHPNVGFEYVMGFKKYKLGEKSNFDVDNLFKSLNISKRERKFIAILIAMHHIPGEVMKGLNMKTNYFGEIKSCSKFTSALDFYILKTHYTGINKNLKNIRNEIISVQKNTQEYELLIRAIFLLTAADNKGCQMVVHNPLCHGNLSLVTEIDFTNEANEPGEGHKSGKDAYKFYKYGTPGKKALKYVIKNEQRTIKQFDKFSDANIITQ